MTNANELLIDKSRLKRRKARWGYLFILPWVLGFVLFFAWPVLQSFWYSLNNLTMAPGGFDTKWVGFDNYYYMLFRDAKFNQVLLETALEMLYKVPLIVILSLFIAVMLNQDFRGRGFFRSVFFLPVIITSGVVYAMLSDVINSNTLTATQNAYIFQSTGLGDVLASAGLPVTLVASIQTIVNKVFALIMESGVQILLFLSGLQKIPPSTYEAARIEGASEWDSFWRITVPQMVPIMLLNVVYSVIDSFMSYGTEETGNRVMAMIHKNGFGGGFQFGLAASMSWIYMAVIAIILLIAFGILGRLAKRMEG